MDIFYALSDPKRRHILEILAQSGPMSASDICVEFKISAPAISQHLKVLKESMLVLVEKKAQQRIYKLNAKKMEEFEKWAKEMHSIWNDRYSRLDELLAGETAKVK